MLVIHLCFKTEYYSNILVSYERKLIIGSENYHSQDTRGGETLGTFTEAPGCNYKSPGGPND